MSAAAWVMRVALVTAAYWYAVAYGRPMLGWAMCAVAALSGGLQALLFVLGDASGRAARVSSAQRGWSAVAELVIVLVWLALAGAR